MNSRQENRSKLSFTARITTKYSLERFLSICGEMSEGFLKFYKLIVKPDTQSDHCLNSYKRASTKYGSPINYARLPWIRYKKQTLNKIITQAYHSRCTENYQVRPKSLQTFQTSYSSSKVTCDQANFFCFGGGKKKFSPVKKKKKSPDRRLQARWKTNFETGCRKKCARDNPER